jgi:hypothetical protein
MKNRMIKTLNAIALLVLIFGAREALGQEFKFKVEHDHLVKSCKGELIIGPQGVEYQTENKDHARKWNFTDIKMIKLESPREIEVISYESSRKTLGQDRTFEFRVIEGEITKQVSDFLLARVEQPLATSFVATEEKPRYELPVRHRHRFGECQGTLKVYADRVIYQSDKQDNSRYWRWTDIQSISRTGPYQFGVTTYEPEFGGPSKTFNFDLKEQMDEKVYDYLWTRVYKVRLPASANENRLAGRSQP